MSNFDTLHSESTPLLHRPTKKPPFYVRDLEKSIRTIVDTNPHADVDALHSEIQHVTGRLQLKDADRIALELLLLLRLCSTRSAGSTRAHRAMHDTEQLDSVIQTVWASLKEHCATEDELSRNLWLSFKEEEGSGLQLCRECN